MCPWCLGVNDLPQPNKPTLDLIESTWGPDGPVAHPGRMRAWLRRGERFRGRHPTSSRRDSHEPWWVLLASLPRGHRGEASRVEGDWCPVDAERPAAQGWCHVVEGVRMYEPALRPFGPSSRTTRAPTLTRTSCTETFCARSVKATRTPRNSLKLRCRRSTSTISVGTRRREGSPARPVGQAGR